MATKKANNPFYASLKRELDRIVSRKLYFGVCIVLPLFCILFMCTIFGSGGMLNIPIGVVDLDQTSTSREIIRSISTVPTTQITNHYPDALSARESLRKKEIYAYIVIPNNFESDLIGGHDTTLPYYIHFALLSVGIEIQAALESTFAEIALSPIIMAAESAGESEAQIESVIIPVNFDAHPLFNPSLDYSVYLTNPFLFVLLQILVLLVTLYVIGSEIKFKTSGSWLQTADMNIFIAVTAKLLPYTIIFIIIAIFGNFAMFNLLHIPLESSFFQVNLYTALFIVATQSLGVFLVSLFPALSLIISVASMVGSLGATLGGVTFPVLEMHPVIYYFSYLFPIRHFVEILQNLLYGDYGFVYMWQSIACLFVFILLALLILPRLKSTTLSHKYEDID